MGDAAFFGESAKRDVASAIAEVERRTSAELVVVCRKQSDPHRDLDYVVGLALAMATLGVLLFHEIEFEIDWMPLEISVAFALGTLLGAHTRPLKRLLLRKKRREAATRRAACEAFVARGIGRTRGRNGVLVYVSALERTAHVVPDVGIDAAPLAPAIDAVRGAVRRADWPAFVAALRGLAEPLAAQHPHTDDDVNELSDALEAA